MLLELYRNRWFGQTLLILAFVVIILSGFLSPTESNGGKALPKAGFEVPEFSLSDGSGQTYSPADFKGKVVILNFWASWCPPCRAEMPAFQKAYQTHLSEGLVIFGINTTYQDDASAASSFARERGITFPVLYDRDGKVSRQYQVQALPTTFFVDRKGIIRQVIYGGPLSETLLTVEVKQLLGEGD